MGHMIRVYVGVARAFVLAGVLLMWAVPSVLAQTYASFGDYATNVMGWHPGENGATIHPPNTEADDDPDGDGLHNIDEYNGWQTTINGQTFRFSFSSAMAPVDGPGPNYVNADTDGDGLSDYAESKLGGGVGTNPHNVDTDGDNLPDAWEVYVELNPLEDGSRPGMEQYSPNADPDGDGLTTWEEYLGANGVEPVIPAIPATMGSSKPNTTPDFGIGSNQFDYTLPLNFDTDGDNLIDSYERDFQPSAGDGTLELGHLNPVDGTDDAYADPDGDGLITFREMCVHPLLAFYWTDGDGIPNLYPAQSPVDPVTHVEIEFYSIYRAGYSRTMLQTPGYLNLAKFDNSTVNLFGNSYPNNVGTVQWGHPLVVRRWTEPWYTYGGQDTDGDLLPDGWELEHGLNPLSGQIEVLSHGVALSPSGAFADPDDDGLMNYEEYWGQDGYRVDMVTGTGDEGNPWLTRIVNRTFGSPFGALIGQLNPGDAQHRLRQAPYAYIRPGVSSVSLSAAFDVTNYPGFFDPVESTLGVKTPIPGVPPYVPLNDMDADGTQSAGQFDPFAVAVANLYFYEPPLTSDGRYTPRVDSVWLDMDSDGIYRTNAPIFDLPICLGSNAPSVGVTGLPLTVNMPVRWPMPGGDTDDDGLKDSFEVTTDVGKGKYPTSVEDALSPFMPRSAFITGTNGIVVPNVDIYEGGRRLFNDDWTIETWVYFRDQGPLEYSGSLIDGDIVVSTLKRTGYDLGVSNTVPYVRFQALGGVVDSWVTVRAGSKIQKNKWTHLAGVYDHAANSLKLFVDGILDQSVQAVTPSPSAFGKTYGGSVFLGRRRGGTAAFATNVWMDEVRIWGVPRTADEIVDNRSHLINPYQLNPSTDAYPGQYLGALFAYFTFDDGGKTAQDFTKRAGSSLLSYDFPSDPDNQAAPTLAYLYGDWGYSLDSDAVKGPNRAFSFDANNRAPVIGMVDAEQGGFDLDGDGLPDGWELINELNPFRTNSPQHSQVFAYDLDWRTNLGSNRDSRLDMESTPDGMNNVYEYYARTNPRDTDTDEDAIPDTFEDFDADGLPNGVEVLVNGRVDLADTDDDGLSDATEETEGTTVAKSTSPDREQTIFFNGYPGSYLDVPQRSDMRMASWTIEATVLPLADSQLADGQSVSILRRVVETATNGLYATTFELRVKRVGSSLTPEARFVVVDNNARGTIVSAVVTNVLTTVGAVLATDTNALDPYPNGAFTHLAVAFDGTVGNMKLYVDGVLLASKDYPSARPPVSGQGPASFVRIAEGFRGYVRDVRIWSQTRSQTELFADLDAVLKGTETNLVSYFSMRDGGWPSYKVLSQASGFLSNPSTIATTNDGVRYIVVAPASGAFSGHIGQVAEYSALKAAWSFETPGGSNRIYVTTNSQVYQYTGSSLIWTNISLLPVKDPTIIRSVRYSSAPTNKGPGDTWWDGANIHTYESTTDYSVVQSGPLFIEGTNVNGGVVSNGTFAWYVSRNEYFRYDSGTGIYKRWGPAVDWLADAKAVVEGIVPTPAGLFPLNSSNLFVGDTYFVLNPAGYHTFNGSNYVFGSAVNEDRIILRSTGQIFDWSSITTNLSSAVATPATDGGGIYIYVRNQGYALRSDGSTWKRWGFIPTTEDFTMKNGWTGQWSRAAIRYGGSFFREFGEERITTTGTRQPVPRFEDGDADGLPDEWEDSNGLDSTDALGDNGPDGDPDGDGLSNLDEYLITYYELGTYSPQSSNSDGDGSSDGEEDADGDGLSNTYEVNNAGTRPYMADSDDDFDNDQTELQNSTDPMDSLSPFVSRALAFRTQQNNSSGAVVVPYEVSNNNQLNRLSLSNWTVECVVNVSEYPAAGVSQPLVSRAVDATGRRNYELGIRRFVTNGTVRVVPYVAFDDPGGSTTAPVEVQGGNSFDTNTWVHLAGRFTNGVMKLSMNGSSAGSTRTLLTPATGLGDLILGGGAFKGYLGEVRVWKVGRSDSAVDKFKDRTLFFDSSATEPGFLRVHGDIGHLKEVAITTNVFGESIDMLDFWTLEAWVKTTDNSGGGIISKWAGGPTSGDYNYFLGLNANGTLLGKLSTLVTYQVDPSNQTTVIDTDINDIDGTIPVNDGKWHHVAFVRDESYCYLYVDGYLDKKQPNLVVNVLYQPLIDLTLRKYEGPLVIGYQLDGDIDEVRVWGRGLGINELQEVSKENLIGTEDSLVSYFNFDYQQGKTADERSALRDSAQEVGIYVPTAERVTGGDLPITVYPLRTYIGAALSGYFAADDGGKTVEDFTKPLDPQFAGSFSNDVTFIDLKGSAIGEPFLPDSDTDGMPDWWEDQYGLGSGDGTGLMGPYGDPDHDGLANVYEWQAYHDFGAQLDPMKFDSVGDGGAGDYDSRPASTNLTYGEMYDDTDQLPDWWELQTPQSLNAMQYNAGEDPDNDGWNNLSEYVYEGRQTNQVGNIRSTDPTSAQSIPMPVISGTLKYEGANVESYHVWGYDNAGMIGQPVAIGQVSNVGGTVGYTIQGDFAGSIYLLAFKSDLPDALIPVNGGFMYSIGKPYGTPYTNPVPVSFGEIKNVDVYISDEVKRPWYPAFSWTNQPNTYECYVRLKNSAGQLIMTRSVDPSHNYDNQIDPLTTIGYFNEVDYQLATWQSTNYSLGLPPGTYSWSVASNQSSGVSTYFAVGNLTVPPYTPSAPTLVSPINGSIVSHARNEFKWSTDQVAAQFELTISPTTGSWTYTKNLPTPWRSSSGQYGYTIGSVLGSGQFTNGTYRWRLRAKNGDASYTSGYSSYGYFTISVTNPPPTAGGSPDVEGSVTYYGYKPASTKVYVQAYTVPSFNSDVYGQDIMTNAVGNYAVKGLYSQPYYLRAFVDFDGDGGADDWEPQGIARDGAYGGDNYEFWSDYSIGKFDLTSVSRLTSARIVLRDRDTDNDNMPDGWEYSYFGSTTPTDTQDQDNDGLSNVSEYACRANPNSTDTDGDGIKDGWEVSYNLNVTSNDASRDADTDGLSNLAEYQQSLNPQNSDTDNDGIIDGTESILGFSPSSANNDPIGVPGGVKVKWDGNSSGYNPYSTNNPSGTDLNISKSDTDGDGISDLEEIAAGSNPLSPTNHANVAITAITSNGSGTPRITWPTYANQASIDVLYTLEYSVDLVHWYPAGTLQSSGDTAAASTLDDTIQHEGTIYYRLSFEIPVQ